MRKKKNVVIHDALPRLRVFFFFSCQQNSVVVSHDFNFPINIIQVIKWQYSTHIIKSVTFSVTSNILVILIFFSSDIVILINCTEDHKALEDTQWASLHHLKKKKKSQTKKAHLFSKYIQQESDYTLMVERLHTGQNGSHYVLNIQPCSFVINLVIVITEPCQASPLWSMALTPQFKQK